MKFICKTEPYRHFRGLLFQNGRATEVTDQATIEALEKHPDFEKAEEKADEKEIQEAPKEVLADQCPRCGKIVKRGKYMHQKWCGK